MRKNQRLHAWFFTSTIIPPDDVSTEDEAVNDVAARPFKGRKVQRRKVAPADQDYENFISKLRVKKNKKKPILQKKTFKEFLIIFRCLAAS